MRQRFSFESKQLTFSRNLIQYQRLQNKIIFNNTFVSPICSVFLVRNISFHSPIQRTNGEKFFNHVIYKAKCRLWREINTSPSIFSFMERVFFITRRKKYGSSLSEMGITVVIPTLTQKLTTKTKKSNRFSIKGD